MAGRSWGTPVIGLDKISISCQNLHGMQSIIVAKGWREDLICNRETIIFTPHPKLAVICRVILKREVEIRDAAMSLAGVICEVANDDGTMARLPDLEIFATRHGLLLVTIEDLVTFLVEKGSVSVPVELESLCA
ncbi:hypothetical protein ATO67_19725 [Agrobacterium bohemicum]|uniref:3,4-dihydroxy-2-butanone 4-phosphate synthase n=1 Tax=Agrobacterium bohemicum TaxID=2052828 RepID=A0A135P7I2_9HYPH|nr:hypothetical protein ATO67_19725 [Agrobacterium bohemicum]